MKLRIYWSLILTLALLKFLLPFMLQSPAFELQRDEYLYYQQGQHLALGYLENPPLLSWLGKISSVFGGSTFTIRFWPALLGACSLIATSLIAAELGGKLFAQFISGFAVLTGAFMRMFALFQPNALDIFFWTATIYFLIRFIKTYENRFLYALAICFAFGLWSKYSMAFLVASIFFSILFSKHRLMFLWGKTYLAILVAVIIILPNVWWQYEHNWPLVHHMQELRQTQLRFVHPGDFIKDQFLFLLPAVFIWVSGLIWLLKVKEWRILAFIYLFVILLLMLGSGKSYYAMGIYPLLLAAGGTALEKWTVRISVLRPALIIFLIITGGLFISILLPVSKPATLAALYENVQLKRLGALKWEDQQDHSLPQDFADMLGWKELAQKSETFLYTLPINERAKTIIYCDNYGQAGALKYYGKTPSFKGKVISTNGSFLLWMPDHVSFSNLIYVCEEPPADDDEFFHHFKSGREVNSVTNIYSRQSGNKILYYEGIDSSGLHMIDSLLLQKKKQFTR